MRYYRIRVFFQRRADAFVSELRLALRTRQSHEQLRRWLEPCGDPRHRNLRRPIGQIMRALPVLAQVRRCYPETLPRDRLATGRGWWQDKRPQRAVSGGRCVSMDYEAFFQGAGFSSQCAATSFPVVALNFSQCALCLSQAAGI